MIRHHDAQDSFSAETVPNYHASSLSAAPPAAEYTGAAAIPNSSTGDGAMWSHSFAFYATPLSSVVLMVAVVTALAALMKAAASRLRFTRPTKNTGITYFIKSGSHGHTVSRR